MVRLELVFGLVTLALWIYCLIESISSDEGAVRNLPKVAWIIIVLLFPFAGSIAWLVAGRPAKGAPVERRHERMAPEFPEYDRPGRMAATDPAADEEFLRKVRERAEAQRRAYREQQRRDERERRGDSPSE